MTRDLHDQRCRCQQAWNAALDSRIRRVGPELHVRTYRHTDSGVPRRCANTQGTVRISRAPVPSSDIPVPPDDGQFRYSTNAHSNSWAFTQAAYPKNLISVSSGRSAKPARCAPEVSDRLRPRARSSLTPTDPPSLSGPRTVTAPRRAGTLAGGARTQSGRHTFLPAEVAGGAVPSIAECSSVLRMFERQLSSKLSSISYPKAPPEPSEGQNA